MIAAAGLDRLIGDPLWTPHPVVWMGRCISTLRRSVEHWSGDHPQWLRLGGITSHDYSNALELLNFLGPELGDAVDKAEKTGDH